MITLKNKIANTLEKFSKKLKYCDYCGYCNNKKKWIRSRLKSCEQYNGIIM